MNYYTSQVIRLGSWRNRAQRCKSCIYLEWILNRAASRSEEHCSKENTPFVRATNNYCVFATQRNYNYVTNAFEV